MPSCLVVSSPSDCVILFKYTLLCSLDLGHARAGKGLQLCSFSVVSPGGMGTWVKQQAALRSPSDDIEIRTPVQPDIWTSVFLLRREEVYLETREGGSALYKTSGGRAAFAMGLWGHRDVSRCHMCLWKTKTSSARNWRQHSCPGVSGAPVAPKEA